MKIKSVRELMLPLEEYALVNQDMTMVDALQALEKAQEKLTPDRQPHRAVLVVDKNGKIVGKLGHQAFLKGLEPNYKKIGDLTKLARAGWSSDFLSSMMDNVKLWKEQFGDYVQRAKKTKVKDVMHQVTESLDIDAPLSEAIHKLVMYETLSILVMEKNQVVGILRLSDVFDEIAEKIMYYSPE